jgi:nitrogen fixation NifU-like protein
MSELRELYQQVILDHNKSPRNFRKMETFDRKIEGYNPLCGDHYTLYLKFDGDSIADVSFQGAGCAISKASASVMSAEVKGKTREEAERLFDRFHRLVTGANGDVSDDASLGKLEAFSGVSEFPARVKCASLPWHTLRAAIQNKEQASVTTE